MSTVSFFDGHFMTIKRIHSNKNIMTTKSFVNGMVFTIIFSTCITPIKNAHENKIFYVDIENCKTSINLKLSDLLDSCTLVPLETTNESILGNYLRYVYIGSDFIIIDDDNGIYKFSTNGKFIKKIINTGRGPHDLSIGHSLYYYEKKNLLVIDDYFGKGDYLLCFDLKSESFLPSIKKCFSGRWGDFIVYNDSTILASIYDMDAGSNPYAIFTQDFKGNFISGVKSKRKCIPISNQKEVLQRMLIYSGDKLIHVKYVYDDTLFTLKESQLSPYFIVHYNSDQNGLPRMIPEIGEKRSYFEKYENNVFLIFSNHTFKGAIPFNLGTKAEYKKEYFFLDKSNGRYSIIKSYTDDFIGKIQNAEYSTMVFPSFLPNNRLYVVYYPHELLPATSKILASQVFPKSLYENLSKMSLSLKNTDNPILLIGRPKKKV
jgi:hypothetical protein